jgi:hypothetical protein
MRNVDPRELLKREVDAGLYREVRELWKRHSIAEDNRDIPGLLATLTPDCVYELVPGGDLWTGHEGAAEFYRSLLAAFPDIKFHLRSIIIGPQGVAEEADVTATRRGDWPPGPPREQPGGSSADLFRRSGRAGEPVAFRVAIFFPWDAERKLFGGERVYVGGG